MMLCDVPAMLERKSRDNEDRKDKVIICCVKVSIMADFYDTGILSIF